MHNPYASQNSSQATNWAVHRRDAIEKAKRLRDDHKYRLALTGKMSIGGGQSGLPIDKHSIPGLRSTGPAPVMTKPSVSEGYNNNTYGHGHRRPMSYIYDKPISEEDLQQAASSLRLLKAKMKNNSERMVDKDADLLDSFAEKPSSQPSIREEEYGYPVKRQYQGMETSSGKAQSLNEIGSNTGGGNKHYRKVFKPNIKQDDQDSLTTHMESRKENLSRQSNVVKRGFEQEEEQPFVTPVAKVIPSRIPKNKLGNTLEKPANKNSRENERALGVKRNQPEQPITNDYDEDQEAEEGYKPAQKQQYQPTRETAYNPSKYTTPAVDQPLKRDVESPKEQLRVPSRGGPKELVRNSLVGDPDERSLKNSRLDVFKGDNEKPIEEKALMRCPEGCGRQFFEDVIEKHAKACAKVFQSKRKQFDISKQRMTEDQQVSLVTKPIAKGNQTGQRKKEKEQVIKGVAKWKRDSEAFRAGMKAARGEELTWQEKVAVAKSEESSMIQCEFCSRKFSEKAAEKHVPFCESKWKKEALKRPTRPTRPFKKI